MQEQQTNAVTHAFATLAAETKRGGRVSKLSTKAEYRGLALARVGDIVTYDDGTEATNIDSAGFAAAWDGKPFAPIGSRLSNGDRITKGLQNGFGILVNEDKPIAGLLDPAYVLPERNHA
ncbi:PAAR domain-containing protein [Ralstonia flaminis]|jgi:uncharacterized Zn-binding protein involved in type VI secretion|uniref:PAAR motif-containing protein n=1 Tax=Ralstonia flaminis TaxID=3058597 RepID=A0ABN9JJF6_9RALS|nr:PAAR domain-containing protein [Ralstonia sp. LMG 18101]CAJ0814023.1 hypothetical protein LMG18101_02111 [Ralstonia sp. LMG 18101]